MSRDVKDAQGNGPPLENATKATGIWMPLLVTCAAGVSLYLLVAGLIAAGGMFSQRLESGVPLLGSVTAVVAVLMGLVFTSHRFERQRRHGWIALAIQRLATVVGPLLALTLLILVFGIADWWKNGEDGNFLSLGSLRLVAVQGVMVGVAALGMTMIIIAGGIDLSVGTALALSGTMVAFLLKQEYPIGVALLGGMLCGGVCGLINGALISTLRLVPFIITLGAMTIYLGVGKMLAPDGGKITPPVGSIPEWLEVMVTQSPSPAWISWPLLPNVAWGVWLALGLAIAVAVLLHTTVWGRHLFAIGSNEATARLCGVPVTFTKVWVYALAGVLVGIAGIYHFARLTVGDATAGLGIELRVIAAVVIGGGSLSGGRGSVVGTLCGAAIMTVINHGCTSLGLENQVEDILLGIIIIAAVTFDRARTMPR